MAGRWPTSTPSRSSPARRAARTGSASPGTRSSVRTVAGSTRRTRASTIPKAVRASSAARPMSQSTPSRGDAATRAARIRPSSRFRRSSSPARRLWLSARRASSSSPVNTIGALRSPVETRSTAAAIARNGAVRSAARANATSTASRAAITIVRSRIRGTVEAGSGNSRWAATTTSPNEARGRTAAAIRAMVSRVRKLIPESNRSDLCSSRTTGTTRGSGATATDGGPPAVAGGPPAAGPGPSAPVPASVAAVGSGRRRRIGAGWPVDHDQVLVPATGWLSSRASGSSIATSR